MKFLIHGYLGFKNLGDELILSKVIEDIRSATRDAEIAVVTVDKEYTRRIHNVEGVVDRLSPDDLWEAIKKADVIVVGGGGLIQEYNDIAVTDFFKSFGYGIASYAIVPFLAKILRKPVFYWAHGVGPLFTEEGKDFTRWFYSLADVTTLRDPSSLAVLKGIYPEAANVYLDVDPVLSFDLKRFAKQPPISLPSSRKKIGLNIRPWFGTESILEKVSAAIQEIYRERNDFVVVPIPFDLTLDTTPLQKILARLPEEAGLKFDFNALENPEGIISLMNQLDFFVGMRLHALIVSSALQIPSLSISYDVKTDDFSRKIHLQSIRVEDLTESTFLASLRDLFGMNRGSPPSLNISYKTPEIFQGFIRGRSFITGENPAPKGSDSEENEKKVLSHFIRSLRAEMKERTRVYNTAIAEKDSLLAKRDEEISSLHSEKGSLSNRLRQVTAEKDDLFRRLEDIYTSDFWKLASRYYRIRNNSRILKYSFRLVQILRREGIKGLLPWRRRNGGNNWGAGITRKGKQPQNNHLSSPETPFLRRPDKYDLIFFPIINWDFRFQRPQQLATRFAKNGHRVFYLSADLKKGSSFGKREIGENLCEITLPFVEDTAIYKADLLKGIEILKKAMDEIFRDFQIKEAVALVEFPLWYPLTEYLKQTFDTRILFDCLDDFAGFGNVRKDIEEVEKKLAASAHLCLATAKTLQEKLKQTCPGALLVPNATDFEHFHRLPPNDLLREVPKPVIGYYGAIAEWFDTDIIEYIASERPEWSLVLIGHTFGSDVHRLKPYRNIRLLGEKPYSELPKFLSGFDVGIIPFRINELTLSTNPVKFFEFLSSGKPMVATKLPELQPFADYVYLAGTKEDFLEKIEAALQEKDESLTRKRIEFARENDWEARVRQISAHIESLYVPAQASSKASDHAVKESMGENEASYSAYQEKLNLDFHKNRYGDLLKDVLKDAPYSGIIFYPSLVEWDIPLFQRPHQIFRELAKRGYLIFFLTPNPEADQAKPLRRVAERIWVIKDIDMMQTIRDHPFILWISWTPNIVCREMFPNSKVVYDFIDELEVFGYYCRSMEEDHQRLLGGAEVVITTADSLLAGIREARPDALLIPNGVCPEDFKTEGGRVPKDLEPILAEGKPLIGYYGALAKWLDYDLIHFAGDACKDFNFVFIGPQIDASSEKLQPRDNLFLLGPKRYEDLKYYLRHFDVATIPFQINRVTNSTSPIKLFEYMAGGKPIVTTDMKECRKFRSVLTSVTFEDFVKNLRKALALKHDPQYLELLEQEANENSWAKRIETLLPHIQNIPGENKIRESSPN